MVANLGPDPHGLIPSPVLLPLGVVTPFEAEAETTMRVGTMTLWVAMAVGPALARSHATDHGTATTGPCCAAETQGFPQACEVITKTRLTPQQVREGRWMCAEQNSRDTLHRIQASTRRPGRQGNLLGCGVCAGRPLPRALCPQPRPTCPSLLSGTVGPTPDLLFKGAPLPFQAPPIPHSSPSLHSMACSLMVLSVCLPPSTEVSSRRAGNPGFFFFL